MNTKSKLVLLVALMAVVRAGVSAPGVATPSAGAAAPAGPSSSAASADESAIFGSDAGPAPAKTPEAAIQAKSDASTAEEPQMAIGGSLYQQLIFTSTEGLSASDSPLSMPIQFDTFIDARPNDRIRAYVLARTLYDSTRDAYSKSTHGGFAGFPGSSTITTQTNNPSVQLDQAWIKFDIEHSVFVTAGKQHVKWGTGHIWNPSDVLTPARRDPLAVYDIRLGNSMVKFDLPFNGGTNLSAIALLDNPEPASTLGQVGGAFRAETVLLGAELGIDTVIREKSAPVYGGDISFGVGDFDVYAELAMLSGTQNEYFNFKRKPVLGDPISVVYDEVRLPGAALQAVAGLNTTFAWRTARQATLGAEYMYNELGASHPGVYPIEIYFHKYNAFYAGKHYAAIYLSAEGPDSGKHTSYNLSTIGNLSDQSFVSRLDFAWQLMEHLSFGAYGDIHGGNHGGEFNFELDTPPLIDGSNFIAPVHLARTQFDLGLSLRVAF